MFLTALMICRSGAGYAPELPAGFDLRTLEKQVSQAANGGSKRSGYNAAGWKSMSERSLKHTGRSFGVFEAITVFLLL